MRLGGGHGLMRAPARSEPVTGLAEGRIEDRLQHLQEGLLHDPVLHRGDAEQALATRRFRNPHPPQRAGPVAAFQQFPSQGFGAGFGVSHEGRDGDAVDAGGTAIRPHSFPSGVEVGRSGHLFHQPIVLTWAFLRLVRPCGQDPREQRRGGFTAGLRPGQRFVGVRCSSRCHGSVPFTRPLLVRAHSGAPCGPSLQPVSRPSSLLRPVLTSARWSVSPGSRRGTGQISPDKPHPFPRTIAVSTLPGFDRCGLRGHWPARPPFTPDRRFLFIDPRFCIRASFRRGLAAAPLRFANLRPGRAGYETFTQ